MADKLDQFESVFRAADKPQFVYQPPVIEMVLVVTDADADHTRAFAQAVRGFLRPCGLDTAAFETLTVDDFDTVAGMLQCVKRCGPDLVATYRNLHLSTQDLRHSLGAYLDTLTQATDIPVLVTPRPDRAALASALTPTQDVLVMTDHLTHDVRAINYGVRFTVSGGNVHLCHIEDTATFDRYMAAIERIPAIDTSDARELIAAELLKQPADFIASCAKVLTERGVDRNVHPIVKMGRCVHEYPDLIKAHAGDLLVCNTKDPERLAMHPLAYALAIEVRDQVLLLL